MNYLYGISGVARAGKDTFANMFSHAMSLDGFTVNKIAFADALKTELDPFFRAFGGTAFEVDTIKKNRIRPVLVSYGKTMRELTNGRYWIEKIRKDIESNIAYKHITIITDVRYNTHPEDELGWIKSLGGKIIYIDRPGIKPANEEEAKNDPLVKNDADYVLQWPTKSNTKELKIIIDKFRKTIKTHSMSTTAALNE